MSAATTRDPDRAAPPRGRRVMVVDDSAVARAVLVRAVEAMDGYRVVASVGSAEQALAVLACEPVDLILLDLALPGESGVDALPELAASGGDVRVVVVSANCREGSANDALARIAGAAAIVPKPTSPGVSGRFDRQLADTIARVMAQTARPSAPAAAPFELIAIGASTGGIHALQSFLGALGPEVSAPILLTQHLPGSFTSFFAEQVAKLADRPVDVARDHLRIRPGRVVIAPGDAHLQLVSLRDGAAVRLSHEPAASGCVPSVDPMFASAAAIFGERMVAVVLSGMGRDGMAGARKVMDGGGTVIAQDRGSSVVWGMPGAVAEAGLARLVGTPGQLGAFVARGRRPA